jgi:phosphoglycolate phosphatase
VHSFVGKGMAVLVERCLTHDQQRPSSEKLHVCDRSLPAPLMPAVNGQFTQIYPGVLEASAGLESSGGIKMGVVTNKPAMFTEALLDRMGMTDYFDVIVSGDTTAHKKTAPGTDPACLPGVLMCAPERNLHIGDSKNDIHAARARWFAGSLLRALRL